jgi:tetratricopeptide (TPR) repeat protein
VGESGNSLAASHRRWLDPVLVAACALAVTAPSWGGGFLYCDDPGYVVDNPILRAPFAEAVARSFSEPYYFNYHPLHILSYWVDYQIWGLSPLAFRLMNAILYALGALLFLGLARDLVPRGAALCAALLFAAHPLHVESAAWVSARKDLLCLVFSLLALRGWLRFTEAGGAWRYTGALLCHALALLSKSAAVMLPLLATLLSRIPPGRVRPPPGRLALALLPWVALAGGEIALEMRAHGEHGGIVEWLGGSLPAALMTQVRIELVFLVKLVVPWPLSPAYDIDPTTTPGDPRFLLALLGLLLLGIAAVRLWRRTRWPAFALLWAAAAMLPTSNLVPLPAAFADRWLLLASVGACLSLGVGLAALGTAVERRGRRPGLALVPAAIAVLAYLALSAEYAHAWRSDDALWPRAVARAPRSNLAQTNYAASLLRAQRFAEASRHYAAALEIEPRNRGALMALALCWSAVRQIPRARSGPMLDELDRVADVPSRAAEYAERLLAGGATPVALALAQRAHALAPEDARVRERLRRIRAAIEGGSATK